MSDLRDKFTALLETILEEAHHNRTFAEKLEIALREPAVGVDSARRLNRRSKAVLDPFELFSTGEPRLREALAGLDLEQLIDIVAAYGMDRSRLALKWNSPIAWSP